MHQVQYDNTKSQSLHTSVNHTQRSGSGKLPRSVSVIIPTTRAERVSQTLQSLIRQRCQREIEILVVGLYADDLSQRWPIVPVNPGHLCAPGRARNLGAQRAKGDVLLFLDDDCTVAEDWVERNVQALEQLGVGAVGARLRGKDQGFFAKCTDYTNLGYYQHGYHIDTPLAAASLGIISSVFHAVNGFDEELRYSEDIALCHQLQKHGYRTTYQPNIIVTHDHRRDTLKKLLIYNYEHGLVSGLTTKILYKESGLKNRLLYSVRFPPLFLLLLPCIAAAATLGIVAVNIPENWDVFLCAPFIFFAKLAYEFGVFRWLTLSSKSVDSTQSVEKYQPRDYWNGVAQRMKLRQQANVLTGDDSPFLRLKRAVFLTKFLTAIPFRGKTVLEVGCGQGGNLIKVAETQPAKVIGCDVSEAMIEYARNNTCNIEEVDLVQVDGTTLPFSDRSFDITFTSTVLQHNLDSMVMKLLPEICRVTANRLYLFEDTGLFKRESFSFVLRPTSEYVALCAENGFELIETEPLGLYVSESLYRILRVIFRRRYQEGVPISKMHTFLEQTALPIAHLFDKTVKQRRGLTKMVFQRLR